MRKKLKNMKSNAGNNNFDIVSKETKINLNL